MCEENGAVVQRLLELELAARDDHRRAADLDALDLIRRAVDAGEERRGPPDLRSLRDLDLVAELDAPVPGEVQRQRPGGRARRRILGTPPAGANILVFQFVPEPAMQLTPSTASRSPSRESSGRSAATASSDSRVT